MRKDILRDPRVQERIRTSGFLQILQELEAYLRLRGYASTTVSPYRRGVAHFALWAMRKKLGPSEVTDDLIAVFLSRHIRRCRCPLPGIRQFPLVRAALCHFKTVLDAGGHRPLERHPILSDVDREVQRFDDHLRSTCGLREATRRYRRRYVREFLQESFGKGPVRISRLNPLATIRFVSKRASRLKPGSAQVLASSLRTYFRFLQLRGECDEALRLAVPSAANWKLARLPKVLSEEEVSRLLGAFDRRTALGLRDYAITRCLSQLGLRASEIAQLRLDDIDWRGGILRIVGGKSRRDDDLPLPASVGSAIAAYLKQGRPQTSARQVFLRVLAPVGQGLSPAAISSVVRRAASRAGLPTVLSGTRVHRNTAATRMLRCGASMKEVADVLRHRSLDTTAIYTKVDLSRLAKVALPWPEEAS